MSEIARTTITDDDYKALDTLDQKSSGLLTFNAIFLAALTAWLGYVRLNLLHLILDFVFLALLASSMLLLTVIWVRWDNYQTARQARTARYRVAWMISAASVVLVIGVTAVHTVGTGLTFFGICADYDFCSWFYSEEVFGNMDRSNP